LTEPECANEVPCLVYVVMFFHIPAESPVLTLPWVVGVFKDELSAQECAEHFLANAQERELVADGLVAIMPYTTGEVHMLSDGYVAEEEE
jgi:hypothetical protein